MPELFWEPSQVTITCCHVPAVITGFVIFLTLFVGKSPRKSRLPGAPLLICKDQPVVPLPLSTIWVVADTTVLGFIHTLMLTAGRLESVPPVGPVSEEQDEKLSA